MDRTAQLQERMSRLRWACRRTQFELDEPLGNFLKTHYANLTMPQQFAFERIVASKDIEIIEWLKGIVKPNDPGIAEMLVLMKKLD